MNYQIFFVIHILSLIFCQSEADNEPFDEPEIENDIICNPDMYNQANWTCEDYENYMVKNYGENLDSTLKCLGYDLFKDPARGSSQTSPTIVNFALKILKIESFNIDTSVSTFSNYLYHTI